MKICFKCKVPQPIDSYYKHNKMSDGHLNKCISCTKIDNKTSNGKYVRKCCMCGKLFKSTITEVRRGGAKCCSRNCYYERLRSMVKKEDKSHSWKGDKVGMSALHNWVERHRGKPKLCEHCNTITAKQFDWANVSRTYKRDLSDWIRLCRSCHAKYDYPIRLKKWKKSVKQLGWNVK